MVCEVKIFFGYQFANTKINRVDREAAYEDILENINNSIAESLNVRLTWKYWPLKNNEYIGEQILKLIDESDILIFDLSEPNLNVFFELGYGVALSRSSSRQVLIILHEDINIKEIGSDLSGKYVLKVNKSNLVPKLAKQISDAVEIYLIKSRRKLLIKFWGNVDNKHYHIICPEIPYDLRTKFANSEESNYLRYSKFADIDSLIYIKVNLNSLNISSKITDYTATEYSQSQEECQIVVGGPAWNRISKEYHKILPAKFEDGGDGNDDPLILHDADNHKTYLPKEDNDTLIYDISFFARIKHGLKENIFIVSGCRTLGVLGAAKVFLDKDTASGNIELVNRFVADKDFFIIFKTKPFYGTVSTVILDDNIIEALYAYDEINSNFKRVI